MSYLLLFVDAFHNIAIDEQPMYPSWLTHSSAIDSKGSRLFIAYPNGEVKMFSYPACLGQEVEGKIILKVSSFVSRLIITTDSKYLLAIEAFSRSIYQIYLPDI